MWHSPDGNIHWKYWRYNSPDVCDYTFKITATFVGEQLVKNFNKLPLNKWQFFLTNWPLEHMKSNFKVLRIDILSISYEIALRRMPQNPFGDKSTLVQVMAWCRQATSHYLCQCWSRSMLPYEITSPQWVKWATWSHKIYRSSSRDNSMWPLYALGRQTS